VDIVWLVVAGGVAGAAAVAAASIAVVRRRWLLPATLLASAAALLLITAWLLAEPGVTRADALRTGGLAGGAVLALHALWINDRRRRTEEARQETERGRAQLDRDRVADERFAKAVELLGHDADQVRVGALHALAGLARSRPTYTQTVLDVLCSYLRRPFTHPGYELNPADPDQAAVEPSDEWPAERISTADREQQVRLTAQRLIATLLPAADEDSQTRYDLDLTAASLDYLDLTGRQIGRFTARRAKLYGITRFSHLRVGEQALFSGAVFFGTADLFAARFDGGFSLMDARVLHRWRVPEASVRVFVDLRTVAPVEQVGELTVLDGATVKLGTDRGWAIHIDQPATPTSPAIPGT